VKLIQRKRLRVGVIYGGRPREHEVSLASAAAVFKNLDPQRYEAVAIKIEKDGRWTLPDRPPLIDKAADVIKDGVNKDGNVRPDRDRRETHLIAYPSDETLLRLDASGKLRSDGSFRDEDGEGVSFDRVDWPHGETGPARPRALLFVSGGD
jgi:D-alanine-D-alanine ligase-like ATP-grasp enzyme